MSSTNRVFEWFRGEVELSSHAKVAVFNADSHLGFDGFDDISFITDDIILYDQINNAGKSVYSEPQDVVIDLGIIFATKHKEKVQNQIALIYKNLADDGKILIIAQNDLGAKSLIKHSQLLFDEIATRSKFHATIFLGQKRASSDQSLLAKWTDQGAIRRQDHSFFAAAGVYGYKKIDKGSKLLIETIEKLEIYGDVADFGSGWGYISCELLSYHKNIKSIDLYESSFLAVESSRKNITDSRAKFHWADVSKLSKKSFDFVITNPPFHSGKSSDISLGVSFIRSAYKNLAKNGKLFLVANSYLPYENSIKEIFGSYEIVIQKDGFKVIKAEK